MKSLASRHDVPEDVVHAIERLSRKELGRYGSNDVRVHAGEDHSGEPAVFIDAEYEFSGEPVDPEALAKIRLAVVELIANRGDDRFPYLRHRFDERRLDRGFERWRAGTRPTMFRRRASLGEKSRRGSSPEEVARGAIESIV